MLGRISNQRRSAYCLLVVFGCAWLLATNASAQTSAFTYQGRLTDGGTLANGNYDLQFALWDSLGGGSQIGATQALPAVQVSDGVFNVTLDFGANAFPGANRFLEISARLSGASSFTLLLPRQSITSTPYAVRSGNATLADTATNATQLGGVGASQYVQTSDSRLTDSRSPIAGSSNYIQNTTNYQSSSNFNISGNGTASGTLSGSVVNAANEFDLGGNAVLRAGGFFNTFVGFSAGPANTTGTSNTFVGVTAGQSNSAGFQNSFFGFDAGRSNTTGNTNSFFGVSAGSGNVTGNNNSFFGYSAGKANNIGNSNSFFGANAGMSNTNGGGNSFFGSNAGGSNTTGRNNTFVGERAGQSNTTAGNNAFFGTTSGQVNTTGIENSFFGVGSGSSTSTGINNSFFGSSAGAANTTGSDNAFVGMVAGIANTSGIHNSFFGEISGSTNTTGSNNTLVGSNADVASSNLDHATAIGANAVVGSSNSIVLGRGDGSDIVRVPGKLILLTLGAAGSTTLCRNGFLLNEIATCSSSLRYKTNLAPYRGGMDVINRLRPITFDWKLGGMHDLGFGAEDVEKIDPLLVTYNDKGQVEGVKYDRISAVLVNALNEQQARIESQQQTITRQQHEIEALKRLVCSDHPAAELCKSN